MPLAPPSMPGTGRPGPGRSRLPLQRRSGQNFQPKDTVTASGS